MPEPAVGDIVTFPGKWKGEAAVGRIAMLQYIAAREEWIADVVQFNGNAESEPGVFREERRRRRSEYLPVSDLRPVTASYVRSLDGWKVPLAKGGGSVLAAAPGYAMGPDFQLPVVAVDPAKQEAFQEVA